MEQLWDAVAAFLDERAQRGGDVRIFERYIRWRSGRSSRKVGSIDDIEFTWPSKPPDHASADAHSVHRIRQTPVSALPAADCTKLISLWLNLGIVVPRATQLLEDHRSETPAEEIEDLLAALIALGPEWWADHPHYAHGLRRALARQTDEQQSQLPAWITATIDSDKPRL